MFAKIFGNVSKESIKRQKTCRGFTVTQKSRKSQKQKERPRWVALHLCDLCNLCAVRSMSSVAQGQPVAHQ